jgi:uncharacterized UBP type Zn finger protein
MCVHNQCVRCGREELDETDFGTLGGRSRLRHGIPLCANCHHALSERDGGMGLGISSFHGEYWHQ